MVAVQTSSATESDTSRHRRDLAVLGGAHRGAAAARLPGLGAPHLRRRRVRRLGGGHASRAASPTETSSRARARCSSPSCGSPTSSGSAPRTPRACCRSPPRSSSWPPPTSPGGRSPTAGGALLAAGLVSATTTSLWITGPLAADGAALAFATSDDGDGPAGGGTTSPSARAVWLGLGIGATVSVKALLAPVIIPVALVLLAGRRLAPIVAGAATAIGFHLAAVAPVGHRRRVGPVVRLPPRGRVRSDARAPTSPRSSARWATATPSCWSRPPSRIGRGALPASSGPACPRRAARPGSRCAARHVGGRLAPRPAHRAPDVAAPRVAARARPRAPRRPPSAVVAGARRCRCGAAPLLPHPRFGGALRPSPIEGCAAEAVDLLRNLPDGALAISDEPGLVWRAGAPHAPDLVDTSVLRIQTGDITSESSGGGRRPTRRVRGGRHAAPSDGAPSTTSPTASPRRGYEMAAETATSVGSTSSPTAGLPIA